MTAIAAGEQHAVALKNDRTVVAWGSNLYGQTNVPTVNLSEGVVAIAAGANHTLALTSYGYVIAWGDNSSGQSYPVPDGAFIPLLGTYEGPRAVAIAAGKNHSLALRSDGTVLAWGDNSFGQLNVPAGLNNVRAIAAGANHSVALQIHSGLQDGKVFAWGNNSAGQLNVPAGLSPVTAIAAGGNQTLAVVPMPFPIIFGNRNIGTPGIRSFLIRNTGNLALTLYDVSILSGGNSADFIDDFNAPGFVTLVPGATQPFTVSFIPSAPGTRTATVRVHSDDADESNFDIPLTGFGVTGAEITIEQPLGTSLGIVTAWGHYSDGSMFVPAGLSGVIAIAAGTDHAVVLKSDGSVLAWGNNVNGQVNVPAPLLPGGGGVPIIAVAAGDRHTVVLTSQGAVVAWGANEYGQTAVPTAALYGVVAIAAGGSHTVALKSDGSVLAWGYNLYGQTKVPPAAQSGVIAIAAGYDYTLALRSDGTVLAWGDNSFGQLNVPAGLNNVRAIAAGYGHVLALKTNGLVVAWGLNNNGQTNVPPTLNGVSAIAAGLYHSVALKTDGTVVVWGDNSFGQLTVPPAALTGVSAIAAAGNFTLALGAPTTITFGSQNVGTTSAAKTVYLKNMGAATLLLSSASLTGGNTGDFTVDTSGMLTSVAPGGQTTLTVTFSPKLLGSRTANLRVLSNDGGEGTINLTLTGAGFGVAAPRIAIDLPLGTLPVGGAVAWGQNADGQATVPAAATNGVSAISAGEYHTIALKADGSVVAWGKNLFGETNVPAAALSGVSAIDAGGDFNVALKSGLVVAWGENSYGQTNVPATALSGVSAVSAGGYHVVALKTDGSVIAWGRNTEGQTTVPAAALSGVSAISAGVFHTVVLKTNGSVLAWGWNPLGQTTVPAAALSGVNAIAAGAYHTLALKTDGSVIAWGYNGNGQTAVPAAALSGVVAIAAGDYHSVALKNDGTIVVWGDNSFGQTVVPAGLSNFFAIAGGGYYTAAFVASPSVAFGDQLTGTTSAPKAFTIRNTGTGPLTIIGVSTVGPNNGDFAVNNSGMLSTIPIGGQTTFIVTFTPSALGSRATTLRIVSNDPNKGVSDIALNGTGVGQPEIQIEQPVGTPVGAVVNFGNQNTNTTDPATIFTITNSGNGVLNITAVSVIGANAADFVVNSAGMLTAIPAGGQTTFSVIFNPTALGARTTTLRVLNNDPNESISDIQLTGVGQQAIQVVIDPPVGTPPGFESIDFGNQNLGSTGAVRTFTIRNTTSANIIPTLLVVTNDNSGDFIVDKAGMLASIPTGGRTTFTVAFHPTGAGARGTVLYLSWNDPGTNSGYTGSLLTGTGIAMPKIALSLPIGSPRVGNVVAWGYGGAGATTVPAGLGPVRGISTAYLYSAALKTDGTVVTWGDFNGGNTNQPADVTGVVAIASAGHMVALKSDGTVVTWGGDGTEGTVPAGLNQVTAVAAGNSFTLALKQDGSVQAWGDNSYGQTNVPAGALSGVLAIAANGGHALALKTNGSVVAWGSNTDGESTVPASALSGVIAIAAGGGHSLAIKTNGSVIAWGRNVEGQATVPVEAMSGVIAVEGGIFNSVALKNDGTVLAWGYGGLGVTSIPPGLTGIVAISASANHVLAMVGTLSLDYGNQSLNTSSAARTFTITNSGTGPLTISSLTATNGNTNDFLLDTIGMITNVPAGSNTTFRVSFSPTALGLRSTTFHLISNDADEGDIAIALSGTGLATGASSPFPLTGMTRLPNGSFRFGFTNQIGLPFTVLTATNVALPLSNWVVLGAPIEAPPGQYQFTDPQATNNLQRFYHVHSP